MSLESELNTAITEAVNSQNTVRINADQIRTLVDVAAPVIRDNQRLLNGTDEQRRQLAGMLARALVNTRTSGNILRSAASEYANRELAPGASLFVTDNRIIEEMTPHLATALNSNRGRLNEAMRGPGPNDPTRNYPTPRQLRDLERSLQNNAMAPPEE